MYNICEHSDVPSAQNETITTHSIDPQLAPRHSEAPEPNLAEVTSTNDSVMTPGPSWRNVKWKSLKTMVYGEVVVTYILSIYIYI